MEDILVPIVIVGMLFIGLPAMVFHYITKWRAQKTLSTDDERMLEDLWRSARAMERRIESLETILGAETKKDASKGGQE